MYNDDCLAVHVKSVSKIYKLRDGKRDPLKNLLKCIKTKLIHLHSPHLEAEVKHTYREFYALKSISLRIRKGESWGFIGVNGSGKSTLLKMIAGNLRPSLGSIETNGKVAILDYGSGFNGEFTGKENIYIKATLLGLTRKEIQERYQSIVEFAEIGEFIDLPIKTYSSGMVSRLGFAIMAHVDADIMITDEALAVGDIFFVRKCMELIRNYLKKGTFLFVSHSITDVLSLCQHAVWLDKGEIKAIGAAEVVAKAYLDKAEFTPAKSTSTNKDGDCLNAAQTVNKSIIVLGPTSTPSTIADDKSISIKRPAPTLEAYPKHLPVFEVTDLHDRGGAKIVKVLLTNKTGDAITQILGGEHVKLTIEVKATTNLCAPIVAFFVMDRLGQVMFSESSFQQCAIENFLVQHDEQFVTEFLFSMPLLPSGSYVFRVSVVCLDAEGKTVTLHTLASAWVIHSVTTGARHGLVGIPMHAIKFKCQSIMPTR